ncbi:MAG: M48 family metallopeptidase [Candidatus Omnitrophota bacterium]|nr:M48 family metallopeptidase [Candidatus Omnitrophota bacterium]
MENRADKYARIKYQLAIIDIAYTLFLLMILQMSGINAVLKTAVFDFTSSEIIRVALYSAALFAAYSVLSFHVDFYRSFVIERRFNLSNQKILAWLADYLKSNVLGFFVFILLMECFFFFIRSSAGSWWWMSAIFWIFLTIVIARIFPVIVIPLFFKYKRIDNESLRQSILALAQKMQVKILDVFEIDYSKKSLKANAAFVGIGKSKRVLLTDTLLGGKFQPKEIEVILAHEFAHYRLKHILKMVAMSALMIFVTFYIFFLLDKSVLDARDIANLGSWILLFMLFQIIVTPFINWIHRTMERNADIQAINIIGDKDAFISMMEKLADQNLAQRKPPLWAKILFYDHPPIEERIDLARKMDPPADREA